MAAVSEMKTLDLMREAHDLKVGGFSEEAISKKIDKSPNWVRSSILIMEKLPASVHRAVQENKISRIVALQLLLCPADKLEAVVEGLVVLAAEERLD